MSETPQSVLEAWLAEVFTNEAWYAKKRIDEVREAIRALLDEAALLKIDNYRIDKHRNEVEAERDALRLDFAAFRATALETSNHLHDVIRERDALREGSDEDARALLHLNDLLTAAEAERDVLRAEVEKKDHDWAGIYAHDMAQVKEQRDKAEAALGGAYTALCALEPLLTTKEQVAHFLRALAFCKYDKHPEWDERVAALRDTTPRVCGCPDCTAPAEPPREEE